MKQGRLSRGCLLGSVVASCAGALLDFARERIELGQERNVVCLAGRDQLLFPDRQLRRAPRSSKRLPGRRGVLAERLARRSVPVPVLSKGDRTCDAHLLRPSGLGWYR